MAEEGEGGSGRVVIVCLIVIGLILIVASIYVTSILLGESSRDQVTRAVDSWSEDGDVFQYAAFKITDLGYDGINESICESDSVKTGEKQLYESSFKIIIDPNFIFSQCDVLINMTRPTGAEALVERLYYHKLKQMPDYDSIASSGIKIQLGKLSIKEDYGISVHCDTFINKKTLRHIC